jgi:hypothetical protein
MAALSPDGRAWENNMRFLITRRPTPFYSWLIPIDELGAPRI